MSTIETAEAVNDQADPKSILMEAQTRLRDVVSSLTPAELREVGQRLVFADQQRLDPDMPVALLARRKPVDWEALGWSSRVAEKTASALLLERDARLAEKFAFLPKAKDAVTAFETKVAEVEVAADDPERSDAQPGFLRRVLNRLTGARS